MKEAEAEAGSSVKQPEPEHVHVEENRKRLGGYGRKDQVLEQGPGTRPGVTLVTVPEPAHPLAQRGGLAALLQFQLGVPDVFVQPACEALAVFVHDVIGEYADWAVHTGPLAH